MASQTEQLEREAEDTRQQLAGALDELRYRLTAGQVLDQIADYAREGPAAEFLYNLGREIRENPLPLLLIAVGIGWLVIATSRSSSQTMAARERETTITSAADLAYAEIASVERSPEDRTRILTPVGA
jgi:hypothetical protein